MAPIKNGWAALSGEGWAVHGKTQDEARENYRDALQRHERMRRLAENASGVGDREGEG